MKKEKIDYFKHFYKVADLACKQSDLLIKIVEKYDNSKLQENMKDMHTFEHEADLLKANMIAQLIKDFLPVIDREDIMALADLYDTVCDSIDDVLQRFYMYNIKSCRNDVLVICNKINETCLKLRDLTSELKGFKSPENLLKKVVEVNDVEEQGDELYIDATRKLFTSKSQNKDLIAWTNIYSGLEECFDACEGVADEIRNVIIKNS